MGTDAWQAQRQHREALKRNYAALFDAVTKAVAEADPIGLFPGCPEDEYDDEVARILAGLRACRDVEATQTLVYEVFAKMFEGISGPRSKYRELAEAIWRIREEQSLP